MTRGELNLRIGVIANLSEKLSTQALVELVGDLYLDIENEGVEG